MFYLPGNMRVYFSTVFCTPEISQPQSLEKGAKTTTIINGYRLWGLFKASSHNSTLPETHLLTVASTCIENQHPAPGSAAGGVCTPAHTAPQRHGSAFSLPRCRPRSFEVRQSASCLSKVLGPREKLHAGYKEATCCS